LHPNTITIKPYPEKVSGDPPPESYACRWWVAPPGELPRQRLVVSKRRKRFNA